MVRDLMRRLPGYDLRESGRTKHVLIDPDGEIVRLDDGRPLTLPNSPSGDYSREMVAKLRKAGVPIEDRRKR